MVFTGNKLEDKIYRRHTGYIGNMKETQAKDMMAKDSTKVLMLAVKGMLPKNSLGRKMLTKLRVYAGSEHEQAAQKPEVYNF
jgi:large subunit ribosomal protein L13